MSWVRWLAPVLLSLVVSWLVADAGACCPVASPQLVQVLDVVPQEVEVGERLAIVGEGFPPGKTARVTFHGTLHRPGERPESGAEVVTEGTVVGPQRVEVAFTEATQALFCGVGDRATHTTFEGAVEVAFAAALPGAPPIAGELQRVVLDMRPGPGRAEAALDREGRGVLSWLGMEATDAGSGLVVGTVAPGSRAEAAGIASGDVLVSVDGLRVASPGDLVPAPGVREARFGLRRSGGSSEETRIVPLEGYRRSPPAELLGAAMIVVVALIAVLLFAAPAGSGMGAAALARFVARLRASLPRAGAGQRSAGSLLARSLGTAARDALPPAGATALVDVLACALLAIMPFGQYLVAAQLDVGLLFVTAATAIAAAALVSSGSPWRGIRAAAHVAWQHAPAAGAVVSVVVATGSLRIQEIERAQGGWPWDWLAFRTPAGLVALVLLVGTAFIEPDAPERFTGVAARMDAPPGTAGVRRGAWLDAACRAHRLVMAGLASALLLGGWILPGLSPAAQNGRPALELAGGAWLLAKAWLLVALVAWARSALPRRTLAERSRRTALALAPLSLAALLSTAVWTWWSPPSPVQLLVSAALVAAAGLGGMALAHRVRDGLRPSHVDGALSPFL